MAHQEQLDFCLSVKEKFPEYFISIFGLDVGSLDINGSNNLLFENSTVLGVDLALGPNVDIVSFAHDIQLPADTFDTIISTECFEHDPFFGKTIQNLIRMLKPGGLLLFTAATYGRPEHGTAQTSPSEAPFLEEHGFGDYYQNIGEKEIREAADLEETFEQFEILTNEKSCDIYFWGTKPGEFVKRENYSANNMASKLNEIITLKENYISEQREIIDELQEKLRQSNDIVQLKENYISEQREIIDELQEKLRRRWFLWKSI
mgnify:CR=1 FL=1